MASQEQDLVVFNDGSIIADKVLDGPSSLAVVSHVDGTQPTWLVNSLIENALNGTATLVNKELTKRAPKRASVTFISFVNPAELYVKGCKKNGLDLDRNPNFTYHDFFTDLFTKHIKNPQDAAKDVTKLFQSIQSSSSKSVVFLECPELLLTSTNITANKLISFVHSLNKTCNQLFVISSHNSQLVDLAVANVYDPVYNITDFLTKLHHRASLRIYLAPLATGRAKDITGTLSIIKGPVPYANLKVLERHYKYHISRESNIKLFFS